MSSSSTLSVTPNCSSLSRASRLQTLKEIVRATEQFRIAEAAGKLLRLPTGDGGALVFRTGPDAPVLCAIEISKALKNHPELRVRMGIHSGPVNEISDLNEHANIAGAGINIAQRVMDCGDAGHILLSKHVADDLEQYPRWRRHLHDLGECEVKHGVRIGLANLYDSEVGNRSCRRNFKRLKDIAPMCVGRKWRSDCSWLAALVARCFFFLANDRARRRRSPGKKHRRASIRKSEPRPRERLFHRWRAGRNSNRPGKDCGPESDQPHLRDAV